METQTTSLTFHELLTGNYSYDELQYQGQRIAALELDEPGVVCVRIGRRQTLVSAFRLVTAVNLQPIASL